MKKIKAIQLIISFNTLEMKRFSRFIRSPYHNNNNRIVKFFDYIKEYHPNYQDCNLEKKRFYKVVLQEDFSDTKWRNLCSEFNTRVEDFLLNEHLKQNKTKKQHLLTGVLGERNYSRFKNETVLLIKELEQDTHYKTSKDYLLLYQLNHKLWFHLETEKFTLNALPLTKSREYFKCFVLLANMENEIEYLERNQFINPENKTLDNFRPTTFDNIEIESPAPPLLNIYKKVLQLKKTGNQAVYFELKQILTEQCHLFKKSTALDLLVSLSNFLVQNIMQKEANLRKEPFNLYQFGVAKKLFIQNERIRDIEFYNIAIAGYRIGENQWVDNFIQTHKKYLHPEQASILIPLVKGYEAFFSKNYELVIKLLSNIPSEKELKFLFTTKTLLLRAFYECWRRQIDNYEINFLFSHIHAFEQLVRRNYKNTNLKKKAYVNFVSILKKIVKVNTYQSKQEQQSKLSLIEEELEQKNPVALSGWLTEKIEELRSPLY